MQTQSGIPALMNSLRMPPLLGLTRETTTGINWTILTLFCLRSAITKFMPSTEVGKVFSVLGVLSSVFPFVSKPFYSFFYKATLQDFPGAYKILTGSLYILILPILFYIHFGMKKQEKEQAKLEEMEQLNRGDNNNIN